MAGHDRLELEETLASERRRPGAHRVAVADRHESNARAIDLPDQRHVREDCRVAQVVDRLTLLGRDDEPAAGAEIDRSSVDHMRGRVPGGHEGEIEILVIERAAGIAGVDLLDALPGKIVASSCTARSGAPVCLHIVTVSPLWSSWPCVSATWVTPLIACCSETPELAKVGLKLRKGSIRMLDEPVSMRKQEWPNHVIFIVSISGLRK
jgi:hypothetical protein